MAAKGRRTQPATHAEVRTGCGRRLVVGRLMLDAAAPIGRVTLAASGGDSGMWTSLTVGEARLLAGYLLAQAGVVERETARE
ncbi:MAG TPA: hypothetical protein VHF06_16825 [Pseudonocardiaceae bacterium]|nr:hypothetical protein [Pseudonocardiaceae bacterium]